MQIARDSVVVVSQGQLSCEMGGEAVIMGLQNGVYYGLNPVGRRIWELLAEPRPVNAIVAAMLAEYDVDEARLEADVLALIEKLAAHGLVDVRPAPAS